MFNYGIGDNSFPLFVFVFLVALGIDYNIFLMTRVREEAGKHGPRRGALTGLAATGGVITSAGFVLAGTFAALGTLPVTFLAELGFAVAFGDPLDTLVVRSVLVTALNLDLGRLGVVAEQAVPAISSGARAIGGAAIGSVVGQRQEELTALRFVMEVSNGPAHVEPPYCFWSPNLGIFAVTTAGVLGVFPRGGRIT